MNIQDVIDGKHLSNYGIGTKEEIKALHDEFMDLQRSISKAYENRNDDVFMELTTKRRKFLLTHIGSRIVYGTNSAG